MEINRYTFQTPKFIGKHPQDACLAFLFQEGTQLDFLLF